MEKYKLFDVIALLEDIPNEKLRKGQVGTIVENLDIHYFEVEFADKMGRTITTCALHDTKMLKLFHELEYA